MSRLKLVQPTDHHPLPSEDVVETIFLSPAEEAYLRRQSRSVNADMPEAIGMPHVIRTLVDRLASSESDEEVTRIAAAGLRRRSRQQRRRRD